MRTAVCVAAFKRPSYFSQCIGSLSRTPEAHTLPFYFFLDGGPNAKQKDLEQCIQASNIKEKHIIKRKQWLGLGNNLISLRKFIYEIEKFDQMFFFEEDMVVTPQYLTLLGALSEWGFSYADVATVQASPMCYLPYDQKVEKAGKVRTGMEIFSGYAMQKDCWDKIGPVLQEYRDRFLRNVAYNRRDNRAIRTWMESKLRPCDNVPANDLRSDGSNSVESLFDTRPKPWFRYQKKHRWTTSQDGITAMALWCAGYNARLTTVANRATHIGVTGENSHPAYYEKYWAPMKLEEIPGDDELTEFTL